MSGYEFITNSPKETEELAVRLALLLHEGSVVTLEGDLGAGKTAFTKGIAKGLGIIKNVNSPTFTIMKEYHGGRFPLYHMDVYRLEDSEEDLGFEEYFEGEGVTIVEWASLIKEQLPKERLDLYIYHLGLEERKITFFPNGEGYVKICEELKNYESTSD
ncbi:tRNA (adenosine(37)-N6)-threonylcarbamoyltransferase complex ATPase subunit type 1 TsaE [Metabacillus arenae]|uniref:tRNA threonylcarbamoyladenosine biosynthesis protein TsaE n=1 Tax=Metabacillus arenae TaxID=2771434 RepID=A0A926NM02_9BACI|nr:tRNA (adenosine(37)-N6)-threonylcarbamoyltransferase complex ATPase subunit type 1 TsaE [Metabacillus arenae]MBD1383160.1 tRNA (adenosine(37)-N6)-threonylcarbamoyltransferase complex ATPase subunit type 1 TsaE [Metabacillus arenae]